jgi:NADH:ubiquinone oxidoreductase subunit K
MFFSLSSEVRAVASWYPTYVSLSTVLLMVALYGLLQMKRRAFWAFLALFILHQAVQLSVHRWDFTSLILTLAIAVASGLAYRRMD